MQLTRTAAALALLLPSHALAGVEVATVEASPRPVAQESVAGPVDSLPFFSPPAPVAPEVIARDEQGRITLRATRLSEPLVLDGRLDDPVYSAVKSFGGFTQQEPDEGKPATEKTEAWIFFDDHSFYVSVRCWDSHPERIVANEMRRDHQNIIQDENVSVVIDTDYDRRNGYYFATNPLGAVRDQAIGDEGRSNNVDWNTVWEVKASVDEKGWVVEMAIPFKSLRFKNTGPQVWSFNLRRGVKWKNEVTALAPIAAARGGQALFVFSEAATLVGVEVPGSNRTLEVKPYGLSSLTTDRNADVPFSNATHADFGFDAKYGLTSGLTADLTYNTDFAQVEEDQQEVNLTRFSLLFPEKREFFLEGQSIFAFGGGSARGRGGGITPIMFFSRRIGLTEEGGDPIRAGGRVTGRAGRFLIGAMDLQTRGVEENPLIPATNFSVLRVKRDLFERSDIGVIATHRNTSLTEGASSNSLVGIDGSFSFSPYLRLETYYALTHTALDQGGTTAGDSSSYTGKLDYGGDRYGAILEHLYVGESFQPEVGFLHREAFRRNYLQGRFSPRPRSIESIRRLVFQAELNHIDGPEGDLETRTAQGQFRVEFENSDRAEIEYNDNVEVLSEEFEISEGIFLPVGRYDFRDFKVQYTFGSQRPVPSNVEYQKGTFWSGHRDTVNFNGRVELSSNFSIEPRASLNWVTLPEGDFTTRLFSARVTYSFSPRMSLSSFIQYSSSSDSLSTSVRFRWEYRPGSDLFFVYSDGREDLSSNRFLASRTVALKFTRLFRF